MMITSLYTCCYHVVAMAILLVEIICVTFLYKSLGFALDFKILKHQNPKCHKYQVKLSNMTIEHTLKYQNPKFTTINLSYLTIEHLSQTTSTLALTIPNSSRWFNQLKLSKKIIEHLSQTTSTSTLTVCNGP